MSHPRAEVDPGVEAEVEEAEAEEGVVPRKTDSKEGDNSPFRGFMATQRSKRKRTKI